MTAETNDTSAIPLLPLSKWRFWDDDVREAIQFYARANVAHALVVKQAEHEREIAAKDAELVELRSTIEALRAEVDYRDGVIATHSADTRDYQKLIREAEASAERLAEALRVLLGCVDDLTAYDNEDDEIGYRPCCHVLSYKPHSDDCKVAIAGAALEQESGKGVEG